MKASIDLGTNTCLLLVLDIHGNVLHDESQVVRLGEKLQHNQVFLPEAMVRAQECLQKYKDILRKHHLEPEQCRAVATAQARDSKNSAEFFKKIKNELGFSFEILSGEQEAQATFLGACTSGVDPTKTVVLDIGGGSTEFVSHYQKVSLPFGAVKITERFFKNDPVLDQEFWDAEKFIDQQIKSVMTAPNAQEPYIKNQNEFQLIAVAGTSVTLAMLQMSLPNYDRNKIDGFEMSLGDAHRWVEELKWRTIQEKKALVGMEPKRADVILAGALIFWRIMELHQFKKVKISTRGLRYGVLSDSFNESR